SKVGGLLSIIGTDADDRLVVNADGRSDITLISPNEQTGPFNIRGVSQTDVQMLGGNDALAVRVTAAPPVPGPPPEPGPPAAFKIATGAGDDSIIVNFVSGDQREPFPVGLLWDIDAGAGNDRVTATFQMPPEPEFNVHANLGDGNDTFDAVLNNPPEPDRPGESQPPEPEAQVGVSVEVLGGLGNDQVNVTLLDISANTDVQVDLGAGNDSFQGNVAIA